MRRQRIGGAALEAAVALARGGRIEFREGTAMPTLYRRTCRERECDDACVGHRLHVNVLRSLEQHGMTRQGAGEWRAAWFIGGKIAALGREAARQCVQELGEQAHLNGAVEFGVAWHRANRAVVQLLQAYGLDPAKHVMLGADIARQICMAAESGVLAIPASVAGVPGVELEASRGN